MLIPRINVWLSPLAEPRRALRQICGAQIECIPKKMNGTSVGVRTWKKTNRKKTPPSPAICQLTQSERCSCTYT